MFSVQQNVLRRSAFESEELSKGNRSKNGPNPMTLKE